MSEMTSSEQAAVFRLLDEYSKKQHQCFVAEMFLNKPKDSYLVCFRPAAISIGAANSRDCVYVSISISEARAVAEAKVVGNAISRLLETELAVLRQRGGDSA